MKEDAAKKQRGDTAIPNANQQNRDAASPAYPAREDIASPRRRVAASPRRGTPLPDFVQQLLKPYFPEFDLDRVRIREGIPWYVLMDADGYTDRQTIYLKPERYDPDTVSGISLIVHEVTHCWQYHAHGTWRFRAKYSWAWLRGLLRTHSLTQAYLNIPFEIEARKVEHRVYEALCRSLPK